MKIPVLLAALTLAAAPCAAAQTAETTPAAVAAPSDVATPEAIVTALYDVISGDAGVARDWDRVRALVHPAGRLIGTGTNAEGVAVARAMTPDDYIARNETFLVGEGFHEREIASRSERFDAIMHVWSTYEARHSLSNPAPFMRGINSIQLFHDGDRWWVLSLVWRAETEDAPLSAQDLPAETSAFD